MKQSITCGSELVDSNSNIKSITEGNKDKKLRGYKKVSPLITNIIREQKSYWKNPIRKFHNSVTWKSNSFHMCSRGCFILQTEPLMCSVWIIIWCLC